eukprot:9566025-Alexandrium_andersonii.AAC.1
MGGSLGAGRAGHGPSWRELIDDLHRADAALRAHAGPGAEPPPDPDRHQVALRARADPGAEARADPHRAD